MKTVLRRPARPTNRHSQQTLTEIGSAYQGQKTAERRRSTASHFLVRIFLGALLCLAAACSSGPLKVNERYYLAASDRRGENINYYRITIRGSTALSVADFRQGWYPADALDAVFGDVSAESEPSALATKRALAAQIDQALIAIRQKIADELTASNGIPDMENFERVEKLRKAERELRIRARDQRDTDELVTIEYDPAGPLVTRRAGEKLIFVLSANPDEILQNIAGFAEEQKTQLEIANFSRIVASAFSRNADRKLAEVQQIELSDQLIANQVDATLSSVQQDVSQQNVLAQLRALRFVVDQVRAGTTP